MPTNNVVINQTRKWLSTVVIGYGLCPFAKKEFDDGTIRYAIIESTDLEHQLSDLIRHCAELDRDAKRETSLLIFPKGLSKFSDYLDLFDLATALLRDQGYEGVYQLASFHPRYRFEGTDENDPSNYTNRSPYPMLHILREASVERALVSFINPENIPTRNIQRTQDLGLRRMKALLDSCYK